MMNRTQWFLAKIAEEAAELSQRAMKAQQFGLDEKQPGQSLNNLERMVSEAHDLIATYQLMMSELDAGICPMPRPHQIEQRSQKMEKFLGLSQSLGMVAAQVAE